MNNKEIKILNGMSVRHAIIAAGLYEEIKRGKRIYDEWDNEIGLDGTLSEDMKIYVK